MYIYICIYNKDAYTYMCTYIYIRIPAFLISTLYIMNVFVLISVPINIYIYMYIYALFIL